MGCESETKRMLGPQQTHHDEDNIEFSVVSLNESFVVSSGLPLVHCIESNKDVANLGGLDGHSGEHGEGRVDGMAVGTKGDGRKRGLR